MQLCESVRSCVRVCAAVWGCVQLCFAIKTGVVVVVTVVAFAASGGELGQESHAHNRQDPEQDVGCFLEPCMPGEASDEGMCSVHRRWPHHYCKSRLSASVQLT